MKEKIMTSMEDLDTTYGIKVTSLRPIPGDRVSVNFALKADADKAREHDEWLNAGSPTSKDQKRRIVSNQVRYGS